MSEAPPQTVQPPFARWAIEVFVIALGVLLAFLVDAGWNATQEARQERLILQALNEEFSANATDLRGVAEDLDQVVQAGARLLELTGPEAVNTAEAEHLIGVVWIPYEASLSTGGMSALLSTGDLARIDNAELRRGLAGWSDREARYRGFEEYSAEVSMQRLLPLIQARMPQIDIELANGFSALPQLRDEFAKLVKPSTFQGGVDALLTDLDFENQVVDRVTNSMIARQMALDLADEADRILNLIATELPR